MRLSVALQGTTMPATNVVFWRTKIEANKARDARVADALRAEGWQVEVVWECETRTEERLSRRLEPLAERLRRRTV